MSDAIDVELLNSVREKDEAAYRRLYDRYQARLYAFVIRRVQDHGLAEEVVADTFFEVWRSATEFQGASRVSTWIFGIATFKSLEADRNRRRLKRSSVIPTSQEVLAAASDGARAEARMEARSELRWLRYRLERLPETQREVAALALFEGAGTDEIAGRLGISAGTVKSRLSRARRELRTAHRTEVH
jgi:RNA polymerase sigma-70 factor (ECF subfamily)